MPSFRVLHLLFLLGAWGATAKVVILPLLSERAARGNYLYGYYALHEVYVGVPLLLLTLAASGLLLVPAARRRALALRLGAAVVSVLVAAIGFDLVFSLVVAGARTPHFWLDYGHVSRLDARPDPALGFVREPGVRWRGSTPGSDEPVEYVTDELGFRNPEGTTGGELAFVGDSYTEAAQFDRRATFPALLGERLGKSVWNLGRGAYGPQQERLVLERYALAGDPQPDVVVWQVFEGNDVTDAEQFLRWRSGEYEHAPLLQRFLQNSLFRPLLDTTHRDKRGDYAWLEQDDGTDVPVDIRYPVRLDFAERQVGLTATENALRAGIAACREAGIRVVVLFVPVAARVVHPRLRFASAEDRARYLPAGFADQRDFADAVRALCADLDAGFVDLLPVFREATQRGFDGIYIPTDEHFDRRGHRLVARALEPVLRTE